MLPASLSLAKLLEMPHAFLNPGKCWEAALRDFHTILHHTCVQISSHEEKVVLGLVAVDVVHPEPQTVNPSKMFASNLPKMPGGSERNCSK